MAKTILIVEDDPKSMTLTKDLLKYPVMSRYRRSTAGKVLKWLNQNCLTLS